MPRQDLDASAYSKYAAFVSTDLFAVASGLDRVALGAAIPPACWRGVDEPPDAAREGPDAVMELGPWTPRRPVQHLVAALSVLTELPYAFRFEAAVRIGAVWSPWVATATIGAADFPKAPGDGTLEAQVDLWMSRAPVDEVRLRLRLRADDPRAVLASPWLVTLSTSDGTVGGSAVAPGARRIAVPAISQRVEGARIAAASAGIGAAADDPGSEEADIGARICSPASVAMVLGYWGRPADVRVLAAEVFHPGLDLYGIWPAAICAAARRDVLGYLLRFPDWDSAAWCLERGLPLIASVRYAAGELSGAAVAATPGHLLVLTGYDGGDVLVNDPAAPEVEGVARRYTVAQITRVWLERAGVGYVLFRPAVQSRPEGDSR